MAEFLPPASVVEVPTGYQLVINVPDEEVVDNTYTTIRPYRGTSRNGSWVALSDIPLVAGTRSYQQIDTSGLVTSWYTYALRTGGGSETTKAEPVPAETGTVETLLSLRRRVARELELFGIPPTEHTFPGPSGTTTATGNVTNVVCSAFSSTRYETASFQDWYLYIVTGSAAGKERVVADFDPVDGAFTPASAFGVNPGSGVDFDLYGMQGAGWWNECINNRLQDIVVRFDWPLVGIANQREYLLPAFIQRAQHILTVDSRDGTVQGEHRHGVGPVFQVFERPVGGVMLYFPNGLPANRVYYVRGYRNPIEMEDDSDTIILTRQQVRLLTIAAAAEAAQQISVQHGGAAEDRQVWRERWKLLEDERAKLANGIGQQRTQRALLSPEVGISGGHPASRERLRHAVTSQYL